MCISFFIPSRVGVHILIQYAIDADSMRHPFVLLRIMIEVKQRSSLGVYMANCTLAQYLTSRGIVLHLTWTDMEQLFHLPMEFLQHLVRDDADWGGLSYVWTLHKTRLATSPNKNQCKMPEFLIVEKVWTLILNSLNYSLDGNNLYWIMDTKHCFMSRAPRKYVNLPQSHYSLLSLPFCTGVIMFGYQ